MDGLSSSVTLPVAAFFAAVSAWWGSQYQDIGVFAGALFGGLAAFLLYNHYPAKVFMGDTGSLFLGGAVCGLAFAFDMPLILVLVGVVYIAETLSDIIQVVTSKPPTANASSAWPPCTTTSRWGAGAKKR